MRQAVLPEKCAGDAVSAAFAQALATSPAALYQSYYAFGGRTVRLRVVGCELARRVRRPFAHLQLDAGPDAEPELTIDLWDELATGVAHPPDSTADRIFGRWKAGGGFVTSYDAGHVLRFDEPGAVTWLERGGQRLTGWRADGARLSFREQSKPLPLLLGIWYYDRDVHVIHAGLVARHGQGVLVGGGSGVGKTTTSLACLLRGFDYLSDDHIGLQRLDEDAFVGHSLYSGARITPGHAPRFPLLVPYALESDDVREDKLLVQLSEVLPQRLARVAAIRAVALPRIGTSGHTRVARASRGEAMLQLAPTSLFTAFGPGARGFERLTQLVERVPSYWLELGSDLAEIPARVEQILCEAVR